MNKLDIIIKNMGFKSNITNIIMIIMNDVEDKSYDDIMEKYRRITKNIEDSHARIYNDNIYSNKDMLEMCELSIKYKNKPVIELLESINEPDKVDVKIQEFKNNNEYYESILEILVEIRQLHNLLSYFYTYELVNEYFKGENMEYHTKDGNFLYVIIVWFIIYYEYYRNTKDHLGEYYYDNEYCIGFITNAFKDMINDEENHRDILGGIEITKELGIIDDKDYEYLMGKYNEVKDIKKEHSLLNIPDTPMQ